MSRIWVLSDLHLFHSSIIVYCSRPFADADDMNARFVSEWNARVGDDDVVVLVGDASAGLGGRRTEFAELLRAMKGRKVLIRGNHDHEPDDFYLENGFKAVREHLFLCGVLFHHFPPSDDRSASIKTLPFGTKCAERYRARYEPWAFLHGHDHRTGVPERPGCFNCAADRLGFAPLPLIDALRGVDVEKAERYISHLEGALVALVEGR